MPTRRNVLRWAATAAATAPLLALASRTAASAATRLPITVVNNTGLYPNSAIWMYVVGTNLSTGQQSYVRADGTLIPADPSLNGADGYADLSIPFQSNLSLPNMSGRIYFSINQKLKFRVVTDGNGRAAFQYPAGWVSSDPSFSVLHDCMEFTFGDGGMFCNTTMVDMFSVPMAIQLSGASNQTIGTLKPGGRDAIFAGIAALPDFKSLIQGNNVRVVAPGHGIEGGIFSSTYYSSYVNDVWNTYTGQDLRVKINTTTYTGRVSGGLLRFDGGVAAFAKPTTSDVFYCNGALGAPNDGLTGPVAAQLGAAFNRSTLRTHPDQPVTDPSAFYQETISNHYSQVIHQNMVDGKAYGFPFDDVGNFASYIQDNAPTAMTLTLTPFGSGGTTPAAGLLSQGHTATASSAENTTFPASNAFDGNASTRWSSLFADPQWLQVDLGASHSVNRVRLSWEAAYAKAYQIQTSTNGSTWTTVYSTTAGAGGVEDRTFTASTARYVRVLGTQRATQYGYSLWSMEVYGS
ncbi:MAG: glycosyl hydrolase [Amycolatopsis sp.]|uniref:beta-1,3-glucanase family protein n=1 Tax=Amycolatopsis sp. TaxID=37632 RepID=UPI00261E108B|nr:beta-1,3-glucanase family protein [Amycolatopsis sp.]MCU1687003.1 glycosyl hydrolase [Amycolatopsis sp.]